MAKTSAGPFSASMVLSLLARRARCDALAGELGRLGELLLQVGAVGDDDDLEGPQHRIGAHRPHQEHHGQALARALGVPDDAAAAVVLAVLSPRLAGAQPLERPADGAVLLVAGDDLDAPAARLGEQREVPDDVEQVGRRQHARDQQLLAGQLGGRLAELGRQLVARQRRRVLPLQEVLRPGGEGADSASSP